MDMRIRENLQGKQHDYMAPFFWLHGEEEGLILNELQRIYDSGIRSVCLESRVHEDFARDGWWSDVRLIMEECRKKDMKVWILDDIRFPTGRANGAFKQEKYEALRPWGITERHIDISGPVTDGCAMADCWKADKEDEMIAVLACKHIPCSERYTEIVDITDGLQNGMVYFSLPEGMWRIVFLIKTRSGLSEESKLFCDMLRFDSIQVLIKEVYEAHYEHLAEYFGNTFLGFFSDEPSFRNNTIHGFITDIGTAFTHYPWSSSLLEELESILGSTAKKALAGLWFDIDGVSETIRYTYMDIITKKYRDNFCNQLADWCHAHNIEYIGHVIEDNNIHAKCGTGAGHYFRALDGQDMSGIDIVLHQIVPGLTECSNAGCVCYGHMENDFFHYYLAKLASSAAHIDPKKKGRAMCEIFGAFGWAEGTRFMKYLADHMLVRGINYYVPHAFSPKLNDPDCPPNFYDSGRNALYKYFRNVIEYMNRVCYLQNDGIHVPTAAILYDAEAHWVNKQRLPLELCAKALYDNLLDYDILPTDVLEQIDENGCLNGENYPCLIVPYYEGISEQVLEKINNSQLKTIVVTLPQMTVKEEVLIKKCEMVELEQLVGYVREQVGADVTSDYEGIFLRYYHYVREGVHSYMFSNEDIHHTIQTKVSLSAFEGGSYLLYDAMENKAVIGYSENGQVEINLPPYNTIFVLFGDISMEGLPCIEQMRTEDKIITPVFSISYAKENESDYTYYKTTSQLCNITGRNELPHFSGNIKYEGTLEIEENGQYLLDLGQVGEAVEVFINGKKVGNKLIPPYAFTISEALQVGKNELTVIVSNHNGYERRDGFSQYLLFEPSGLLGPITLKKLTMKELKLSNSR